MTVSILFLKKLTRFVWKKLPESNQPPATFSIDILYGNQLKLMYERTLFRFEPIIKKP